MRRFTFKAATLCGIFLIALSGKFLNFSIAQEHVVFSTWEVFEADKCATIWLIKRFVDKNAQIKFFPKGEPIEEGIPFDTPDADLRRFHNRTTFDSFLNHYQLKDEKLELIRQIIYDIEINIWDKKRLEQTTIVQQDINNILNRCVANEEIINQCCEYFDRLYRTIER